MLIVSFISFVRNSCSIAVSPFHSIPPQLVEISTAGRTWICNKNVSESSGNNLGSKMTHCAICCRRGEKRKLCIFKKRQEALVWMDVVVLGLSVISVCTIVHPTLWVMFELHVVIYVWGTLGPWGVWDLIFKFWLLTLHTVYFIWSYFGNSLCKVQDIEHVTYGRRLQKIYWKWWGQAT